MEKQEKKEKKIITENRKVTLNKREISLEGLASQLENGEDGIYNLITENKNQIFKPKISITEKDLAEIPFLAQLRKTIEHWEILLKKVRGRDAFLVKNSLIEMRKDQYLIKNAYRVPIVPKKLTRSKFPISLPEVDSGFDELGYPVVTGVTLLDPKICSEILCNYSELKQEGYETFRGDLYYLMLAFDSISETALADQPVLERLTTLKIDGLQNEKIQQILKEEFGTQYSVEYISSLWRNKIPRLIASEAENQYLYWYYLNHKKGKYKVCSRCGQIKLIHHKFFSKNNTSKDGYYSICKDCRKRKKE